MKIKDRILVLNQRHLEASKTEMSKELFRISEDLDVLRLIHNPNISKVIWHIDGNKLYSKNYKGKIDVGKLRYRYIQCYDDLSIGESEKKLVLIFANKDMLKKFIDDRNITITPDPDAKTQILRHYEKIKRLENLEQKYKKYFAKPRQRNVKRRSRKTIEKTILNIDLEEYERLSQNLEKEYKDHLRFCSDIETEIEGLVYKFFLEERKNAEWIISQCNENSVILRPVKEIGINKWFTCRHVWRVRIFERDLEYYFVPNERLVIRDLDRGIKFCYSHGIRIREDCFREVIEAEEKRICDLESGL